MNGCGSFRKIQDRVEPAIHKLLRGLGGGESIPGRPALVSDIALYGARRFVPGAYFLLQAEVAGGKGYPCCCFVRHPAPVQCRGCPETYSVRFTKTKLSTVRPTHRTIASIPSTSILPPLFVRVSVLLLTPISAPTCAQDIPRERRWASIASNRATALNLPGEVILMPPCSQACMEGCNMKRAAGCAAAPRTRPVPSALGSCFVISCLPQCFSRSA